MIEKILDIIFPKVCLNCGKQGEDFICSSCFKIMKLNIKLENIKNKPYEYLVYIGKYKDDMRKKMLRFKFGDSPYIAEYFIKLLTSNKNILKFLKKFDVIIPVPMFKSKKLSIGYNQTEILADKLSKEINIPYDKRILERVIKGKTQSLLNRKERIKNIENVFNIQDISDTKFISEIKYIFKQKSISNINYISDINNFSKIRNKNIILLDDIFTTGATVQNCSHLLKNSGAKIICVFTVCKAD